MTGAPEKLPSLDEAASQLMHLVEQENLAMLVYLIDQVIAESRGVAEERRRQRRI